MSFSVVDDTVLQLDLARTEFFRHDARCPHDGTFFEWSNVHSLVFMTLFTSTQSAITHQKLGT